MLPLAAAAYFDLLASPAACRLVALGVRDHSWFDLNRLELGVRACPSASPNLGEDRIHAAWRFGRGRRGEIRRGDIAGPPTDCPRSGRVTPERSGPLARPRLEARPARRLDRLVIRSRDPDWSVFVVSIKIWCKRDRVASTNSDSVSVISPPNGPSFILMGHEPRPSARLRNSVQHRVVESSCGAPTVSWCESRSDRSRLRKVASYEVREPARLPRTCGRPRCLRPFSLSGPPSSGRAGCLTTALARAVHGRDTRSSRPGRPSSCAAMVCAEPPRRMRRGHRRRSPR